MKNPKTPTQAAETYPPSSAIPTVPPIPAHLRLYDEQYFAGGGAVSGYDDYQYCRGVLTRWAGMVEALVQPTSVLDVGAAYGFLVEYFQDRGVAALGVEPSAFARSQVRDDLKVCVVEGALPDLPTVYAGGAEAGQVPVQCHTVTCTEVLEHVPEELVPASLAALAAQSSRYLVLLIMLDLPGADGDEGHICLKSADWWNWQLTRTTGFVQRHDLEATLNAHPYSQQMLWSGRFFVRERTSETGADHVAADFHA